jgi:hypothetical protein
VKHLVQRFFWSLRRRSPGAADTDWVRARLSPAELRLWTRMDGRDQVHSLAVARRVAEELAPDPPRDVVTAALLHDCGKGAAHLGVPGRVLAAAGGWAISPERRLRWSWRVGLRGRMGSYLRYPEIGAALLAEGGSAPLVVAWAAQHHQPEDEWTIDPVYGRILARADETAA